VRSPLFLQATLASILFYSLFSPFEKKTVVRFDSPPFLYYLADVVVERPLLSFFLLLDSIPGEKIESGLTNNGSVL